jgi:hypothetical protein
MDRRSLSGIYGMVSYDRFIILGSFIVGTENVRSEPEKGTPERLLFFRSELSAASHELKRVKSQAAKP